MTFSIFDEKKIEPKVGAFLTFPNLRKILLHFIFKNFWINFIIYTYLFFQKLRE